MPKVKIYSTNWCAFCKAEMRFLDEHGVKYESVNVEDDERELNEMLKLSGQTGVPFTVVTRDDGTSTSLLGFDQAWLKGELQLA